LVELAASGYTDKEIAVRLKISEGTVATYWERIRAKLGPHHRSELVALCTQEAAEVEAAQLRDEIRDLQSQLRQSESEREHERQLSALSPTPLLTVRCDGRIDDLNPAAEELLGYAADTLRGRCVSILFPEYLQDAYYRELVAVCEAKDDGEPHRRCLRIRTADARRLAVRLFIVRHCEPPGFVLACSVDETPMITR